MNDEVVLTGVMPADKHSVVIELKNGRHYLLDLEHMLSHLMCMQQKRLSPGMPAAETPPILT